MKFSYRLKGLCCADCADKIERNVAKIKGVSSANLAFMTERLTIEAEAEPYDEMLRIIRKFEPEVVVAKL